MHEFENGCVWRRLLY
jgi:hypothetical protein